MTVSLSRLQQIVRQEGVRALLARALDSAAEERRRRSFREVEPNAVGFKTAVLNVLTTAPEPWLGGVQQQLRRRLDIEAAQRPVALLSPDRTGFRLEMSDLSGERMMARFRAGSDSNRGRTLGTAIDRASRWIGAGLIHLESMAGVTTEWVSSLCERRATVLSVHDFNYFCPRPHLLEQPENRFCDYSRDLARCAACLRQDEELTGVSQASWRELGEQALRSARHLIFPSGFMQKRHCQLFSLGEGGSTVIEPGVPHCGPVGRDLTGGSIGFVGKVHPVKGSRTLPELASMLRARSPSPPRVCVFGTGPPAELEHLASTPGVELVGYYRSGSLAKLLHDWEVRLALLLSVVPESYGLALDECILAGVPCVVFDQGAMAERVRRCRAGWAVPREGGTAALADAVMRVWADGTGMIPTPDGLCTPERAAREHQHIYAQLIAAGEKT